MLTPSSTCRVRVINTASPSYLLRALYAVAAAFNASGVLYALTFLRRTNGALSIRSRRMLGPLGGNAAAAIQPVALTYASSDAGSIEREKSLEWTTRRLIERWWWHNNIRTAVLVVGTLVGAYAVTLDLGGDY